MAADTSRASPRADQDGERLRHVPLDGGGRLAYAEYGPADGDPVVFLHGTPGSRRLGELFEGDAGASGVRLIAPDRPGYGRSSPRPDLSIRDADRVVAAVLDDAGVETADLIAFSGGAPYGLAAAAALPDRVGRVDLVAGATPPAVTDERPPVQRLLSGMAATTPRLLAGAFRAQRWLARRRDPSFVVAQYTTGEASGIGDREAGIVRADFLEALARHRSGVVTEFRQTATDWGVDLEAIEGGVRLWHGDDDANVPIAAAERFASELPTGTLRVLDGADHLRTLLRGVPEILREYGDEEAATGDAIERDAAT